MIFQRAQRKFIDNNTTLVKCSIPASVKTLQQCIFQGATGLQELVITAYAYVDGGKVEFIQEQETACKVSTLDYEDASLYTITYQKATEVATAQMDAIVPSKED